MKKISKKWIPGLAIALTAATAMALTPVGRMAQGNKTVANRFHRATAVMSEGIHPSAALTTRVAGQNPGPSRITAGGTNLYGYLTAGRAGNDQGLYEFGETGFSMVWKDPLFSLANGYGQLMTSWYRNGKMCGFDHWYEYGYLWGQTYYEIDFNSGTIDVQLTDEDCIYTGWFINACYDSDSDIVYGYGTDDEEEAATAMFMKTSGTDHFNYEIIKDYGTDRVGFNKQCLSMCYNSMDKNLYGINLNKEFVRIDKTTGDQTVLFQVPADVNMGLYVTGMAYSATEGLYYWNCNYDKSDGQWGSDLYTINAETGVFTRVDTYEGGDSFSSLFVVGENISTDTPQRPEFVSADFASGSTSGTLTYKMPVKTANGQSISGSLAWTFTVDGADYSDGTAQPGEEVEVAVNDLSTGEHTFGMSVTANGKTSPENSISIYVGSDRPKSPGSVVMDGLNVHWAAVTEGVNGGYIDVDNMEYEVFLNGELQGTTKRTTYQVTLPEGAEFQKWQASVVAVCDGMRSNPAFSNTIMDGEAWKLPVDITCSESMLELMTVVNANGDDEGWAYTDWEDGWYSGQVDSGSGTGDDWIILPPVYFPDASKYYSFYMDCMKKANIYPDTWLEVYIGDYPDPEMLKNSKIMERFSPQSRDYKEYGNPMFRVPEAGEYYIGIRCITNEEHLGCIIRNIRIEDNSISPESPAAPDDLKVTAGANGALEAAVEFTMPSKTVKGTDIPASTVLTAVVSGENEVTLTGHPGEKMNTTVQTVQGDNTITVVVNNGEVTGERAIASIYTGVSIPGSVKNLQGEVAPDMMSISMTWEAPDAEKFGGYVDPATVDYYFCIRNPETGNFDEYPAGTGVTSGTFRLPEGMTQDIHEVGVSTENAAGSNNRVMVLRVQLGAPWNLPITEDFESEGFIYQPWVSYTDETSNVSWGLYLLQEIATEWAGLETMALVGYTGDNSDDEGMLGIPRFSTKGVKGDVTVSIKYWAGDQAANLKVLGSVYGMKQNETLHNCALSDKDEWKTANIKLPASMINQEWVQIYLDALFSENHNYCIIEDITIYDEESGIISTVNPDGAVSAGEGVIRVSGFDGSTIDVYTAGGVKTASVRSEAAGTEIRLPAGIYMVTVEGRTYKVAVR